MAAPADDPIPGTAAALAQSAQQLYEDERSHGEALDGRINQLTAFSGLLLTLIAPLGANRLGKGHGPVFDYCYVASVLLFAVTALLAVSSTYRTRKVVIQGEEFKMTGWRRTGIKAADLATFHTERTLLPTVEAHRQIILDLVTSYEDVKELNGRKFTLMRQVSLLLCAGLLTIAAQAVILVL